MFMVRFVGVLLALVAAFTFTSTASAQDDLDCDNFVSQAAAQTDFNRDPYNDPDGLDGPIGPAFDGVQYLACEDNPAPFAPPFSPPTATPTATPVVGGGGGVAPSASPHVGLPDTGATDGMTGLALGVGALLLGAGVATQALVRRRHM